MRHEYIYGNGADEAERLSLQTAFEAKFLKGVINRIGIQPGQTILDLGSGSADVTFMFNDLIGIKGDIIGIDIDPKRVTISQQKAKEKGLTNMSFIQGDVLTPLNLPKKADVAFSNYLVAHLGEKGTSQMAENMKQALKTGGKVAIHDLSGFILQGIPEELNSQFKNILATLKVDYGVDAKIGLKLGGILKKTGFNKIEQINLKHNTFDGIVPAPIIKNWELRLSAPGWRSAMTKVLGNNGNADTFKENFLGWLASDTPRNKHIHTKTVLAVGTK